jgi:uncharacterized protein (TIGR02453 family)
MSVPRFDGFPAEAFEFYDALAGNNERAWWQANRSSYETNVRAPLVMLLDELAPEFGAAQVYRPYRDTRFSKDKTPIKDHQGAVVALEDAIGYYVQVSAAGLMVAGGWYAPQGQQIVRFREAVAGGHAAHVRGLVHGLEKKGWDVQTHSLKTRPRGVDAEDPNLDVLRYRCLTAARYLPADASLGTRRALTSVRNGWRAIRPTVEWLADHVGPATDPASEPVG